MAKAGKMRVLAAAGTKRSEFFPETPTLRELGFDQVEETKLALLAPKSVPQDVMSKLRGALLAALQESSVQATLRTAGVSPFLGTAENGMVIVQDYERAQKTLAIPEIRKSLDLAR
jgi:tripartite-type tricarboxylate transporter receptor subunit TctC